MEIQCGSCVAGIEKTFREHLQKLREQLQSVSSQAPPPGRVASYWWSRVCGECVCVLVEGEGGGTGGGEGTGEVADVESLLNKLSDYKDIIKRQEELLQV